MNASVENPVQIYRARAIDRQIKEEFGAGPASSFGCLLARKDHFDQT
jgi:hypothetical protein